MDRAARADGTDLGPREMTHPVSRATQSLHLPSILLVWKVLHLRSAVLEWHQCSC